MSHFCRSILFRFWEKASWAFSPVLKFFREFGDETAGSGDGKRAEREVVRIIDFKVFGSRARGDADEYSDMDIFLKVESMNRELKEKVSDIAWEIGFNHCMVLSILIFTKDEIENSPLKISPIVKNILEEGVTV